MSNAIKKTISGKFELSKEEFISIKMLVVARNDPVFFGEAYLGLKFYPHQKLWLWATTKTQKTRCKEMLKALGICFTTPANFEQDVNKLYNEVEHHIFCVANQCGKEQSVNENILTPDGWKKMGDIQVGDYVYSQGGNKTRVSGIFPQGKKEIYDFVFDDGSKASCGLEHLWLVQTPNQRFKTKGKQSVLTTREIIARYGFSPKPFQRISIPMTKPVEFEEKKVQINPYLFGCLLGDGCFKKGSVSMSSADKKIIDILPENRKINKYDYFIYGYGPIIREMGLENVKSNSKYIPENYKFNSINNRIELLRGLMDTDGYIGKNGRIEFYSVSKKLAEDVIFLVNSLGGKAKLKTKKTSFTYKGEKKQGQLCYRVPIRIMINPFKLERKAKLFRKNIKNTNNRVLHRIEYRGREEAKCIMVEDSTHTYLCNNFVVTHNTVMTAVKHIWACFFKIGKRALAEYQELDDYKTLNTSPHSDQANKCFEYFQRICNGNMVWYDPEKKAMIKNYPHPVMSDFISGINSVEKEIRCKNGSIFWSKPSGMDRGSARAGEQFGYISLDEGSQSLHLEDTISYLLSRLIRYGFCFDIVSTPEADKPSHAYYMNITRKGIKLEDDWFALTGVSLDDNVFIEAHQKEKAKKSIMSASPVKYNQIIKGKFVSLGEHLFSIYAVRQMFSDPSVKRLEQAFPTRKYILSIDWAMSDKGDKTWFVVLDYTDYLTNRITLVHHQAIQGGEPYIKYAAARDVYQRFGGLQQSKFIMDTTAMGGNLIKQQLSDMRPIDFNYNGKKDEMLMFLNMALTHNRKYEINPTTGDVLEHNPDYGKLRSYHIQDLEDQLSNYRTDDRKIEQDGVMALAQAIWWIEKLPKNLNVDLDINPMNRYNNIRTKKTYYRNY